MYTVQVVMMGGCGAVQQVRCHWVVEVVVWMMLPVYQCVVEGLVVVSESVTARYEQTKQGSRCNRT